jgi:hypothetical protein
MYFKSVIRVHFKCILAFLFVFFYANGNFCAFSKEKSDKITLSSSDNKKLEKAGKELQRSKDAMKEADKIYEEIAAKQANLTSEESEKLNNKALSKQIEALKIQQSANKMKFEVYTAKADEFWKNYKANPEDLAYAKSLESGARIGFQSSEEQYKEADKGQDKLLVYSSMTSASDLSNKAVDDIKKAFDVYSTTPYEGTTTQATVQPVVEQAAVPVTEPPIVDTSVKQNFPSAIPIDTTPKKVGFEATNIYQAIQVNENMIDKFNKFMKEKYPTNYENYIVDFSALDFSDVNSLKNAWDRYLYGNTQNEELNLAQNDSNKSDSLATATNQNADSLKVNAEMNLAEKGNKNSAEVSTAKKQSEVNKNTTSSVKSKKWKIKRSATDYSQGDTSVIANKSESSNKYSKYEGTNGFQYRVQIVASRVPMTNDGLRLIYNGAEQPEENYENEWYKYSIGPFSSFAEARQFRGDCGVKGAFVVAFVNGKKINPNRDLVVSNDNSNSFTNFSKEADLIYKVQVAACRNEMPDDELKKVYENSAQLEKSFEDNWYKYLIDCGNDYNQACILLRNLRIPGAFIAIYRNQTRISIK